MLEVSGAKPHVAGLDGLRVLAILGVVIYHANSAWLPGGFLGVTVFFVVSGYLITTSLLAQLDSTGAIDYKTYVIKRVRRLWPTMVVVVLATAILSAILAPELLQKMQPDAVPALVFFSNWWYLIQDLSYFAASGLPSPLTHFWYLAVLFQFYLVWPLVLMLVCRISPRKRTLLVVAAALTALSFLLMVLQLGSSGDASRVYYGTDTRLAEIMVGCFLGIAVPLGGTELQREGLAAAGAGHGASILQRVLAVVQSNRFVSDALGLASLAAIVAMSFAVNGYTTFLYTGGLLLVAVLSAVAIMAVSNPHSLLGKLLGLRPFGIVGARSYAVYLWHYPLLLIMNPATRTIDIGWLGWLLEFAAIAAVACLSYAFVEQRYGSGRIGESLREAARKGPVSFFMNRFPGSAVVSVLAIAAVVLLAVGPAWAYYEVNHLEPPKTTYEKIQALDLNKQIDKMVYAVDESGTTNLNLLLIGDSVAAGCKDQFEEIFPNGYIDAEVSRQLIKGVPCYEAAIESGYNPDVVVFALGTNGLATEDDVEALIDAAAGKKVFLVNNRVPEDLQDMNNELFAQVAQKHDNVSVIDWYSTSAGHDDWFWDDGTHVRPEGAEEYMLMIRRAVLGS